MRQNGRTRLAASFIAGGSLLLAVTGCGEDDRFKNEPRPPVPTQLTGVITDDEVTVSPDTLPLPAEPGQQEAQRDLDTPIVLIINNQTQQAHRIILTGKSSKGVPIEARTPLINPFDTGQIQQSLPAGVYEVRAGSDKAVDPGEQIAAATLTVRPNRQTSSDDLLLP